MQIKWEKKADYILTRYNELDIYFRVPQDFKIEEVKEDTWSLLNILLFSTFHPELLDYKSSGEKRGDKIGLAFSTGVDSTACMLLLPEDTILSYMYRDFESGIKHENAMNFIRKMDRKVYIVPSNHEKIRTFHGKMNGFSVDMACTAHLVLMADYHKLGYIAAGTVLENGYLSGGYKYREFKETDWWVKWSKIFKDHGLNLFLPVIGMSEVVTTEIVNNSKYKDLAYSCLRKEGGCDNCYKCFRKGLLSGEKPSMNYETKIFINKKPPKMASSLIYGLHKEKGIIPELTRFMSIDFSFLKRYNPNYFDTIPKELHNFIKNRLSILNINEMNKEDIEKLKKVNLMELYNE